MATFTFWSVDLTRRLDLPKSTVDNLVTQVKRAEKNTFTHNEVLDFDLELKKRNTNLAIVVDRPPAPAVAVVAAYLILARTRKAVLLHKVCVLEDYRRRGIAKALLKMHCDYSMGQGCQRIQLWVDEANTPARCLYSSVGFVEIDRMEDYYTLGRNGIKMVFD